MRWEIIDNTPKVGDVRFKTRFAFFPTKVLSKLTMTDHIIWLELYIDIFQKLIFWLVSRGIETACHTMSCSISKWKLAN